MAAENIFSQYAQPYKTVADYTADADAQDLRRQQLVGAQRQNALAALVAQQQQQTMQDSAADRNALQALAGIWNAQTTPDQRIAAMRNSGRAGLMTQADALEKQHIDRTKGDAEAKAKQAEVLGKVLSAQGELATRVMANPTREAAAAAVANMKAITASLGLQMDFSADEAAIGQLQSPDQIKQWAAGHALKAEQLLPKLQVLNTGNAQVNQAIDPLTGKPTNTGTMAINQSPDNAATVRASMANAAALREQAQATRDAATIQTGFKNESDLRKEFEGLPEVKNYKQAYPAFAAIKDAATRSTPQADINLVYGIAKLYDPTSVVREGEYATVANSPNIPERIKGYAQYIAGGGKLSEETKRQIVAEANSRIQSYQGEVVKARKSYDGIAKQRGMNPAAVFQAMGDEPGAGVDAPKPAAEVKAKNAKGWALHTDAKGSKAYVSPDGKQYEEVK